MTEYTKTKYGELPSDWSLDSIGEYVVSNSYGPRFSAELYDDKGNCRVIRGTDVKQHGKVEYSGIPLAQISEDVLNKHQLVNDDLVVVTTADCGVAFVFDADGTYMPSAYMVRLRLNNKISSDYLCRYFESPVIKSQVKGHIRKGTVANLPGSDLLKFKFFNPPLPEQKKIAKILSTVDGHIDEVDGMIDDLKELKKGLMQKLLTEGIGHTEFKDSSVGRVPIEWSVVKQGDVSTFYNGRAYKRHEFKDNGTPIVRIQNLTGEGNYVYSDLELNENKYINKDDLIYAWSATFGPFIWKGDRAIYHYHIWKIECSSLIDKMFYYYRLNFISNELDHQKNGSAFVHITKGFMEKHEIALPPLSEQKKIANILSSIDERIDGYREKMNDLNEVKKGLMQNLLTGKVRVNS